MIFVKKCLVCVGFFVFTQSIFAQVKKYNCLNYDGKKIGHIIISTTLAEMGKASALGDTEAIYLHQFNIKIKGENAFRRPVAISREILFYSNSHDNLAEINKVDTTLYYTFSEGLDRISLIQSQDSFGYCDLN